MFLFQAPALDLTTPLLYSVGLYPPHSPRTPHTYPLHTILFFCNYLAVTGVILLDWSFSSSFASVVYSFSAGPPYFTTTIRA